MNPIPISRENIKEIPFSNVEILKNLINKLNRILKGKSILMNFKVSVKDEPEGGGPVPAGCVQPPMPTTRCVAGWVWNPHDCVWVCP